MKSFVLKQYHRFRKYLFTKAASVLPDRLEQEAVDKVNMRYLHFLHDLGYDVDLDSVDCEFQTLDEINLESLLPKQEEIDEETERLDEAWEKFYRHISLTKNFDKGLVLSAHYKYPEPQLDLTCNYMCRNMSPKEVMMILDGVAQDMQDQIGVEDLVEQMEQEIR